MVSESRVLDMRVNMDGLNLVAFKPFNKRNLTLSNIPINEKRSAYRSNANCLNKARKLREQYLIRSPTKSLNMLRQLLQEQINTEIDSLLQKYFQLFFEPAIKNIQNNSNNINNEHPEFNIKQVFQQILDDAKKMYTDYENEFSDMEERIEQVATQRGRGRPAKSRFQSKEIVKPKNHLHLKTKLKSKKKRNSLINIENLTKNKPMDKEVVVRNDEKWDPSRLTTETLFVLGSKANKALGFGAARGRLYSKHADLFRYIGDQEDKEWLHKNQLMPPTGGKAYLLVKEDIVELINSEEYKNTAGVKIDDMGKGFTVPDNMVEKMAIVMQNMRTSLLNRNKIESKARQLLNENSSKQSDSKNKTSISSSLTNSMSDLSMLDSELPSPFYEQGFNNSTNDEL